jgi:hypothetical protein
MFDMLSDNEWEFNALTAIPSGLGLSFAFDGSSANITTTAAGTWAFTFAFATPGADAGIRGVTTLPFAGYGSQFGPIAGGITAGLAGTVLALPAGASSAAGINVLVGATANPYTVFPNLCIVRLG